MGATMAYCDFCKCEQCQNGDAPHKLTHAQTIDGRWICDICFSYDECVRQQRAQDLPRNPCANIECDHRPRIVGEWK